MALYSTIVEDRLRDNLAAVFPVTDDAVGIGFEIFLPLLSAVGA
jgi:hypothetical protein